MLKNLIKNPWGQDRKTLIRLAIIISCGSKAYGQTINFSAPESYLKKLQGLDSKAIKLALAMSVYATTLGAYREAGILSLDENTEISSS